MSEEHKGKQGEVKSYYMAPAVSRLATLMADELGEEAGSSISDSKLVSAAIVRMAKDRIAKSNVSPELIEAYRQAKMLVPELD